MRFRSVGSTVPDGGQPSRRRWTRLPSPARWLVALVTSAALVVTAQVLISPAPPSSGTAALPDLTDHAWPACAAGAPSGDALGHHRTLVLYDTAGRPADGPPGIVDATLMGNLASHFGTVRLVEVTAYRAGQMLGYDAVVYVGSRYGEVLPAALVRDVNSGRRPVLWLKQNVYQLGSPDRFRRLYGWLWKDFGAPGRATIRYRSAVLHRPSDGVDATTFASLDRHRVRVLATAAGGGGGPVPWAVRSRNLTYVGDLPFDDESTRDGSLALADLLHDLLPDASPDRHRALVRIEDIGPTSDPADLRDIARAMRARHIPYSIAVYPLYVGPATKGKRQVVHLAQRPEVVRAIVEMLDGGASLVLHGYSHQLGNRKNPLSGESGADFEFFITHLDRDGTVVYDGPVPGDSAAWARNRLEQALGELRTVGLPRPQMFNVPHYAASATDYQVIANLFPARYDRGQYFSPAWDGSSPASAYMSEQPAPYVVRDVYGSLVVPEDLGYVSADPAVTRGVNTESDILAGARAVLAVRDGVASFFYHPFLGSGRLVQMVERMQHLGYTFVSPCELDR